jgi:hypothetical protein
MVPATETLKVVEAVIVAALDMVDLIRKLATQNAGRVARLTAVRVTA